MAAACAYWRWPARTRSGNRPLASGRRWSLFPVRKCQPLVALGRPSGLRTSPAWPRTRPRYRVVPMLMVTTSNCLPASQLSSLNVCSIPSSTWVHSMGTGNTPAPKSPASRENIGRAGWFGPFHRGTHHSRAPGYPTFDRYPHSYKSSAALPLLASAHGPAGKTRYSLPRATQ